MSLIPFTYPNEYYPNEDVPMVSLDSKYDIQYIQYSPLKFDTINIRYLNNKYEIIVGFTLFAGDIVINKGSNDNTYIKIIQLKNGISWSINSVNPNIIRTYGNYNDYDNKIKPVTINTIIYRPSSLYYELIFPEIQYGFFPSPATNLTIYKNGYSKIYHTVLTKITIYYDNSYNNILGFSALLDNIGNTKSAYYKTIDLTKGFSIKINSSGKRVYGNYDEFTYKNYASIKNIFYRNTNGIYELLFPDLDNSFTVNPVTNSELYNKEFSKIYIVPNGLKNIVIYYESRYNNIVGFSTEQDFIGKHSYNYKLINFSSGISFYYNDSGRKVYGNYDDFMHRFNNIKIQNIMFRNSNDNYEILFPDLYIGGYMPYMKFPVTNPIYNGWYSKNYNGGITLFEIYYNDNEDILGFSTKEEIIGTKTKNIATISNKNGLYFKYNSKGIRVYLPYMIGNMYKYTFNYINIIIYKVSNGIYELRFSNLFDLDPNPFIEKQVTNSAVYTKEYSKTYIYDISKIYIFYNNNYEVIGFSTPHEQVGKSDSSITTTVFANDGYSYYFTNKNKKVYGAYYIYANKVNKKINTIKYRVSNGIYELEFY